MSEATVTIVPRRNIELKARCEDLTATSQACQTLGARYVGLLVQTDTYFFCRRGRLKLREIEGQFSELIGYERPDTSDTRASLYHLAAVPDPAATKALLASNLGVRGVVKKRRQLWMWENVRIHLDHVDGLGTFVEFEAVVQADDDAEDHARIAKLCEALAVNDGERVAKSYSDLLGI